MMYSKKVLHWSLVIFIMAGLVCLIVSIFHDLMRSTAFPVMLGAYVIYLVSAIHCIICTQKLEKKEIC